METLKEQVVNNFYIGRDYVKEQHITQHIQHQNHYYGEEAKKKKEKEIPDDVVQREINNVLPFIKSNRLWFCILKVLMLRGRLLDGDFDGGRDLIMKLFPAGVPNMFDPDDVSKLNEGSFRLEVDKWTKADAPIKRDTDFLKYKSLAERFDNNLKHYTMG